MNDRELLDLAAKAAGIQPVYCYESRRNCLLVGDKKSYVIWKPLTDDGDALRLAVKLNLDLWNCDNYKYIASGVVPNDNLFDALLHNEKKGKDAYAATRRAIVRAAAEIGRSMP
jgi:hypothetical protein